MNYKILSIRFIRSMTGMGLKDSKYIMDAVDNHIVHGQYSAVVGGLCDHTQLPPAICGQIADTFINNETLSHHDASNLLDILEKRLKSETQNGFRGSCFHREYIKEAFSALIIAYRGSMGARELAQEAIAYGRAMGDAMQELEYPKGDSK